MLLKKMLKNLEQYYTSYNKLITPYINKLCKVTLIKDDGLMGHKKIIIAVSALILLAFTIKVGYEPYYNLRFESALKEAAKVPSSHWDDLYKDSKLKNAYRVVIIVTGGEDLIYGEYFKYSAERLGWKAKIFNMETLSHEDEILAFDPDFIIMACFSNPDMGSKLRAHRSKKYSLNFPSFKQLRQQDQISTKQPDKAINKVGDFNRLSHGVLTSSKEVDLYRKAFEKLGKPFYGLRLLPLVPRFDNEPAEPKRLMWVSSDWDNLRKSIKYTSFIKKLNENVPMRVYGHYISNAYLNNSNYAGYITPGIENINAMRKNGIYLLSHFNYPFEGDVPSIRSFEAAAANVVIISDKHPFMLDNFGDSVLYYDQTASSEAIYKQIKSHLDWILKNPQEAKALAAKAHKIFLTRFTLEKDLIRIAKMYQYNLIQDKKMWNLDYPVGN